MRSLDASAITELVRSLCIEANLHLPADVERALRRAAETEPWPLARDTLGSLCENLDAARAHALPICQDTGMAFIFAELGQELCIMGDLTAAVNEGVRLAYTEGYLRKSVVADPLRRVNTEDNTPAVLHVELVPGDSLRLTVMPKGFGSENMSRLTMLKPADGVEGVKAFVLDTVRRAGANACPPLVVGVGIGGSFDQVAALAKRALLRPIDRPHPDPYYAALEAELLTEVNRLGLGPEGFGGRTTALGLCIETLPTHVAGLPIAVNLSCHVTRRASGLL